MDIKCSFCNISSEEARATVERSGASICLDCLNLIREILDEFAAGEIPGGRGICSFCGSEHGGARRVFQGKQAGVCTDCIVKIEEEMSVDGETYSELLKKTESDEYDLIEARVREEIRNMSAYSVPHFSCRVRLDGNESPFPLSGELLEKVTSQIKDIEINRYPDPEARVLRERISQITGFPSEGIVMGNGSDELIGILIATFTGGTGKVLYPVPTFSMYRIMTLALGQKPVEVNLNDDFDIDLRASLGEIDKKNPDLIFIASPNNPTGNVFSNEKIYKIIEGAGGVVAVDEAYCDFSGTTFLQEVQNFENLVILRSMSKVGFAGIRLGILFANERLVSQINKVRAPYNVNAFTQKTAEVILDNAGFVGENIELIKKERERVYNALELMPEIEPFPSDANFILFRVSEADRIYKELINRDILIRNMNSPGRLRDCLRVTIGTPGENDAFIKAITKILN